MSVEQAFYSALLAFVMGCVGCVRINVAVFMVVPRKLRDKNRFSSIVRGAGRIMGFPTLNRRRKGG